MKAIVRDKFGPPDILRYVDIDKPSPKDNQVLIKVRAASVNAFDWRMLMADPFLVRIMGGGLFTPKMKILGADAAGIVEAVGPDVTRFAPGDEVFGSVSATGGGFAEYVCALETQITRKPASMSFEQAAAIPMAALTALQGLRDGGRMKAGHKVLINGASGGVGTFAVQIAKTFDTEVTAVCSAGKMEMVRSLGADHVIDYAKEDFTKSGKSYDLIFFANGSNSLLACKRVMNPGGSYVVVGGTMLHVFQAMLFGPLISRFGNKRFLGLVERPNQKDLQLMAEYFEAGKVKPVMDRQFPLEQTAEALRYVNAGHAIGKVVISVD